jgi:hypothetical protein
MLGLAPPAGAHVHALWYIICTHPRNELYIYFFSLFATFTLPLTVLTSHTFLWEVRTCGNTKVMRQLCDMLPVDSEAWAEAGAWCIALWLDAEKLRGVRKDAPQQISRIKSVIMQCLNLEYAKLQAVN